MLKVAQVFNRSYHKDKKTPGYSLPTMPKKAVEWISLCVNIVRAQFLRCMSLVGLARYRDGNVYDARSKKPKHGVVVSQYLGEYNADTATTAKDIDATVTKLISDLETAEKAVKTSELTDIDELLSEYCQRPLETVFPFDESKLGLNTKICKDIYM